MVWCYLSCRTSKLKRFVLPPQNLITLAGFEDYKELGTTRDNDYATLLLWFRNGEVDRCSLQEFLWAQSFVPFRGGLGKGHYCLYPELKSVKSSVQLGGEGSLGLHIEQHEKFESVELVSLPHCGWMSSKTRLRLCSSCTWQLYHPKGLADEAVSVLWCRLLSCLPAYVCYRRELGVVRLWNLAKGHSEWVHLQHIDMEKKPSAGEPLLYGELNIVRTRKFWAACTCGHGINFLSFMDQLSFCDFSRIKHQVFFC